MATWTNFMQVNQRAQQSAALKRQTSLGGGGSNYLDFLQQDFTKRETAAREANLARETEVRGTWDELIGEGFGAARALGESKIARGYTQERGLGMKSLIDTGMYSTTNLVSVEQGAAKNKEESMLMLEDILKRRTNELKLGKAAFVERIEDPYPDYSVLMNAMIAAGNSGGGGTSVAYGPQLSRTAGNYQRVR